MRKITSVLAIVSVMIVSGCVNLSGTSLSGVGLLGLGQPEYIASERISVNVETVPSTVRSGRKMKAFFDVINSGNTTLRDVVLKDIDNCVFTPKGTLDNIGNDLRAGEKRTPTWEFDAPSEIDMKRNCDMRYRVLYNSTARAVFNIKALSENEYIIRERAGDLDKLSDVRYEKTKTPVEIMTNVSREQPMMAGEEFLVHFHLKNKGDGFVQDRMIGKGDIVLSYPKDMLKLKGCQGRSSKDSDDKIYFNETELRDGRTARTSCKFHIQKDEVGTSETGAFNMFVNYTYVKDGTYSVSLAP